MAYTVKKVDEYGVFTISKNINLLSDAINLAKQEKYLSAVIDNGNGLTVWSSQDHPSLKKYLELDHEQWQTLEKGNHPISKKPSIYFDIDGTLGKWYSDARGLSLEEMINPSNHYFKKIEEIELMVKLAKYLHEAGEDVCVVSASYKDTIRDKWDWIDEHLPFIPKENIFFAPIAADKTNFVKGNADISILIDDYNLNLEQWKGVSIKAINGINSHQTKHEEIDFSEYTKILEKFDNAYAASSFAQGTKDIISEREYVKSRQNILNLALKEISTISERLIGICKNLENAINENQLACYDFDIQVIEQNGKAFLNSIIAITDECERELLERTGLLEKYRLSYEAYRYYASIGEMGTNCYFNQYEDGKNEVVMALYSNTAGRKSEVVNLNSKELEAFSNVTSEFLKKSLQTSKERLWAEHYGICSTGKNENKHKDKAKEYEPL